MASPAKTGAKAASTPSPLASSPSSDPRKALATSNKVFCTFSILLRVVYLQRAAPGARRKGLTPAGFTPSFSSPNLNPVVVSSFIINAFFIFL